jgi:hypothetical protein
MDIKCVVCGEPWDSYGVDHGDMLPWESKLFRAGAGCPCCEGEGNWVPQGISDFENGDEDEMKRINAFENRKRIPWRRPDPKVKWTCEGCGVQVVVNPEDDCLEYQLPLGAKGRQWWHSHPYDRGEPTERPAHTFGRDTHMCEFCIKECYNCGEVVSPFLENDDMYGHGYCQTLEPYGCHHVFCTDCVELSCPDCLCMPDDCDCDRDREEDEE